MKKYVAICATLAALAWAGVAAATVPLPPAQITGSATSSGGFLAFEAPVMDGGASFFGLENDRSGNCNGDSAGIVNFNGILTASVCAHYVAASRDGSGPKMRFAVFVPGAVTTLWLFRISDGGPNLGDDKVGVAMAQLADTSNETATAWVNTGRIGSGNAGTGWQFQTLTEGNYTISTS
jgi:hypothetical protein